MIRILAVSVAVSLAPFTACNEIKSKYAALTAPADSLVGTWRQVDGSNGEQMIFESDGKLRIQAGPSRPDAGELFVALARAFEGNSARYSRGGDKIVITFDAKAFKKAVGHLPKYGPDTLTSDTFDMVSTYKLEGDILELSSEGKTHTYVRVR